VKIELDTSVEASIRSVVPRVVPDNLRFAAGWLDRTLQWQHADISGTAWTPKSLRRLGWDTMDAMLKDAQIAEFVQSQSREIEYDKSELHPKDREIIWGYVDEAREGVNRAIDELDIPPVAGRYLRGVLDNTPIELDTAGDLPSEAFWDRSGNLRVKINIPNMFMTSLALSQIFGRELFSPWVARGHFIGLVAHELGHCISHAMYLRPRHAQRFWSDPSLTRDYAIRPLATTHKETWFVNDINATVNLERFAEYFEWQVVEGCGCRLIIQKDFVRMMSSGIFKSGFSFRQFDYIIDGMTMRRFDKGEYPRLTKEEKNHRQIDHAALMKDQFIHSFCEYYPFDKETVEQLIVRGWKSKLRHLRHGAGGNETA
jgi:hypothetical protein